MKKGAAYGAAAIPSCVTEPAIPTIESIAEKGSCSRAQPLWVKHNRSENTNIKNLFEDVILIYYQQKTFKSM
jgi:hypothetical protein